MDSEEYEENEQELDSQEQEGDDKNASDVEDGFDDEADATDQDSDGELGPSTMRGMVQGPSAAELAMHSASTSDAAILGLEVNELLAQVQIDHAAVRTMVDQLVHQLSKALASMTAQQADVSFARGFVAALGVDTESVAMPLRPPVAVAVVGSYATCTVARPGVCVDVAVEMPAECFHQKAYINHRYHARRGVYLACMAHHLSTHPLFGTPHQHLVCVHDDPRRPALLITPSREKLAALLPAGTGNAGKATSVPQGISIRLLPCIGPFVFALHKLDPTHNALREHCKPGLFKTEPVAVTSAGSQGTPSKRSSKTSKAAADAAGEFVDPALLIPTPVYNAGLVEDVLLPLHARHMASLYRTAPSLRDGLVLLKAWARAQGLERGPEGLGGHLLATLVALVSERNTLAAVMTPLQLARAVLQLLAAPAAQGLAGSKGLAMAHKAGELGLPPPPPLAAWRTPTTPACATAQSAGWAAAAAATQMAHTPRVSESPSAPQLAFLAQPSPPAAVLVDFTGWCNAACHLTRGSLAIISAAARRTLSVLDRPADADEAFAAAFLSRGFPAAAAYDYVWRVRLPQSAAAQAAAGQQQDGEEAGAAGRQAGGPACSVSADRVEWREDEARIEALVRHALGDRATCVHVIGRSPAPTLTPTALATGTLLRSSPPASSPHAAATSVLHGDGEMWVGACMDPALAGRLVDVGPSADDTKASSRFRSFWGERAELRRFQDGKITEALVWEPAGGPAARHTIPDMVVQYTLARHVPGCSLTACSHALDSALAPRHASLAQDLASSRSAEASLDKLSKQLRALDALVLKVVGVQPLGAAARGTALLVPGPHPLAGGPPLTHGLRMPRCVPAIEVLVQLENSGRWPDDPLAFKKMKAALGLSIAQALTATYSHAVKASEEHVDVLMDGFAFRLVLYSGRDEAMLMKALSSGNVTTNNSSSSNHASGGSGTGSSTLVAGAAASGSAISAEQSPLIASWHHGLVSAVAGNNASFGPSVRLAKRWVAAAMLSQHVPDEAIELVMVAAYTGPATMGPPASRLCGLLRWLDLLSTWPWSAAPLVVDPSRELGEDARRRIREVHAGRRAGGQSVPAMYLATPRDWQSSNWTQEHPSPLILQRLMALATASKSALLHALQPSPPLVPGYGPAAPNAHILAASTAAEAHAHAVGGSGSGSGGRTKEAGQAGDAPVEKAWLRAAFDPRVASDFDCLLVLRKEALPLADYALRPMGSLLLPEPAGDGDVLSEYTDLPLMSLLTGSSGGGGLEPAAKRARAFLRAFPEQALHGLVTVSARAAARRGTAGTSSSSVSTSKAAKGGGALGPNGISSSSVYDPVVLGRLQPELLVGFDPLPRLLSALEERFGHLATFCVDGAGGRVVGVKWSAAAFLPQHVRVTTAHTSAVLSPLTCIPAPLQQAVGDAGAGSAIKRKAGVSPFQGLGVPNMMAVLSEMLEVGEGLLADVVMCSGGGSKLC